MNFTPKQLEPYIPTPDSELFLVDGVDGCQRFYRSPEHRIFHRDEGPAVILKFSTRAIKAWYRDGELHHEAHPAIECGIGDESYYLYGTELTKAKWLISVAELHKARGAFEKGKETTLEFL